MTVGKLNVARKSRWAPASDAPSTERWSRHTSSRAAQSCSLSPLGGNEKPVRRSSATTTSQSASNGSSPRAAATSATVRPSSAFVAGVWHSVSTYWPKFARPKVALPSAAFAMRSARPSADARSALRSSRGRVIALCQPGIVSSRKPEAKLSRGDTGDGIVRPSTRPPSSAAVSLAPSWADTCSASPAITIRTFQLSGRSAAADMRPMRVASRSVNVPTPGMNSRVVPSWRDTSAQSASSSASVA